MDVGRERTMTGKLKKDLGFLEVFCISSGAMISSGLFILPALAYSKAGPAVILAYALAGLLIIPTVLSKAELTTAMPKTGGIYFFTDRSMGPLAGTMGGLAAWLSLAFKSAFALLGIGIFLTLFSDFSTIQIKLIAVACCIVFAVVNIVGVKLSGRFQVIMVIGLIALIVLYIVLGFFNITWSNYTPFTPKGAWPIISTAGLVFVSYAGTTKIAAVAGEVKNPGKNLPLGMFASWGVVTLLYILVIFVTVGVVEPDVLRATNMPISEGGDVILPFFSIGLVLMSIAAMLAFVSTGNSGTLAASRDPMAMAHDGLLPEVLGKTTKFGTPWVAILVTSGFMIGVILFLNLETFVKTASTLKLTLFILANLSMIFMREANMKHYRPKFKAPFYPWIQIIGILAYGFLIIQMGMVPLAITMLFIMVGFAWYWFFSRKKIKREYALLSIIKKLTEVESDHVLDEELRGILVERDNLTEERFENKLKKAVYMDVDHFMAPEDFAKEVAPALCHNLKMSEYEFNRACVERGDNSNMIVRPTFAIITFDIEGKNQFQMAMVRTLRGARFSDDFPPVHAAFIVVHSPDQTNFYLHSLMWLIQIAEWVDFENEWKGAMTRTGLRLVLLKAWEKRVKHMKRPESNMEDDMIRKM